MFKNLLCKVVSAIRRMNEWWDKDEEKVIASVVTGIIILVGILALNKAALFIIALFLILNRVIHRCDIWTLLECDLSDEPISSQIDNGNSEDEESKD